MRGFFYNRNNKELKMKQIGGKYERKSGQKFFVGYSQRSIPM